MTQHLLFLLLGLGAGAVYAGIGMGVVVGYTASGVINFAHGAFAMYAAYVYDELRKTGDLVLPVIGLPARVHVMDSPPFLLALAVGLATGALLGLLAQLLVFRPLSRAPLLARVVASVGLMVTVQAVVVLRFGTERRSVTPILSAAPIDVFGVTVPRDRFLLVAVAVATAFVLWILSTRTRAGTATRAAAESEKGAMLLGFSTARLAAGNWAVAGSLAALFGILVSPITGLDPSKFTLLIIPALAAALLGKLRSFVVTAAAGLALGMLQSEALFLTTKTWFPTWARTGFTDALPFVVIIVALVFLGDSLPTRGSAGPVSQASAAGLADRRRWAPLLVVAGGLACVLLQGGYRFALVTSMISAIIMLSFVVLTGYVGQISLAQAALAGMSGFSLSRLASDHGVPFPISPLLAAGAATVLGLVIGLPALRVRGIQLAVVTLAGAVAIEQVLFRNPALNGGLDGSKIPSPTVFGADLGPRDSTASPRLAFCFFVLVVLAVLAIAVANLRRSDTGRRMLAVRTNERAAAAGGISVVRTKLLAFGMSAFLAGLGGAMLGYFRGQLSVESFSVFVGLQLLAIAYLGGITTVAGALVGGALAAGGIGFTVIDRNLEIGDYYLLISGVSVIVTAVLNPEGVATAIGRSVSKIASLRHPRPAPTATAPQLIQPPVNV
jgi:branched-chain amino acid transport system permease protein